MGLVDISEKLKAVPSKNSNSQPTEDFGIFEDDGATDIKFWDVDNKKNITINRSQLERFLTSKGGFALYFYDSNKSDFDIIQDKNSLVEVATTETIKKFVKEYILSLPKFFDGITRDKLLEVIYKGSETYFSKGFFEFFDRRDIRFLKDTAEEAYFPFKNGVVVVTKESIDVRPYREFDRCIWKSQKKDFEISILALGKTNQAEYKDFLWKVSGEDESRYSMIVSLTGYLLHRYKNPAVPIAAIFAEETDDDQKGGGAGKGIAYEAIQKLINVVPFDGKDVDLSKNFAWQRVSLDTNLIVIHDCKKNIDFEGFNSKITDGLTIERKNKQEIYLKYEDSPKFCFTTNYTIALKGNHGKRRAEVFEFSNFFRRGYTPETYFKHKLFNDWDPNEWNLFYNYMFSCVSFYLAEGIVTAENSISLKRKHIKLTFTEEFLDWWDQCSIGQRCAEGISAKDLYNEFLLEADIDKKTFSSKRFHSAMKETAEIFGLWFEKFRDKGEGSITKYKTLLNTR